MLIRAPETRESGQATVEWVGLIVLVSLLVASFGALAAVGLPGAGLAQAIASKLVCAVRLSGDCPGDRSALELAYGAKLAEAVTFYAPDLLYESGMSELPVDYRECREDACSIATDADGESSKTVDGLRAVAFTHVIDCSSDGIEAAVAAGANCSGERAGKRYLQYWLYWPDSQTEPFGERGYHQDDWESFQVRIGKTESVARASSHHSYNYSGGVGNWPSDAGVIEKAAWGPYLDSYHVSAGSHAGHVAGSHDGTRMTPGDDLVLLPIEAIADAGTGDEPFEVVPPWLKPVYDDPEAEGT